MIEGYLVIASEQRIVPISFVHMAYIYGAVLSPLIEWAHEYGNEDTLAVGHSDEVDTFEHWFCLRGIPCGFAGNGVLLGFWPGGVECREKPLMPLEKFKSQVVFARRDEIARTLKEIEAEGGLLPLEELSLHPDVDRYCFAITSMFS